MQSSSPSLSSYLCHGCAFAYVLLWTADVCRVKDCGGLPDMQAEVDDPVAIYAEGKEHAMAVGICKLSTADMRSINKGIAVDNVHYLNDGLWKTKEFS